eukprot:Tamp_23666.p2 GENE.Tamp_23666~~Tamp_23666.p2  ORF type:complete len:110 (+),score=9.37 Tamp_23666:498-827(+)
MMLVHASIFLCVCVLCVCAVCVCVSVFVCMCVALPLPGGLPEGIAALSLEEGGAHIFEVPVDSLVEPLLERVPFRVEARAGRLVQARARITRCAASGHTRRHACSPDTS